MSSFLEPLLAPYSGAVSLHVRGRPDAPVATTVEGAFDSASRTRGLLGRASLAPDHALVIAPCSAIHTFGMQFPIDVIKIDRSFITDVDKDPGDAAIVQAVIELGAGLGMTVIAEGVENERQVAFLRSKGCAQIQGDLYSKPMAAEDVPLFLEQQKSSHA